MADQGNRTALLFIGGFGVAVVAFLTLLFVLVESAKPAPCAICEAVTAGELAKVRELAAGADAADRDAALAQALGTRSPDQVAIVGALLDAGADAKGSVAFKAEGRTTRHDLELGAATGKPEIVTLLIGRGADVKGEAGGFALRRAVESGSAEVLGVLIDAGAPLGFRYQDEDVRAFAQRTGHEDMVRLLVGRAK